jgi:hypothetical protein
MRSSFVRAMTFQSTTKFLPGSRWFLGSLQFITDKFGDLNLQEPESSEVTRSGTGRLPPASVWVGLINEALLRHWLNELGKTDLDPTGDKADHILTILAATTDPIFQSSLESDSEGGREVYMVGDREELPEKTTKEIQREAEEEIARVAHLARELDQERVKGKKHNGLQDDSGASDDEPRDGAPIARHHPKFNSRCPTNRDRLRNRSRSICEEMGPIEYQGEQFYRTPAQNALASRMLIN